MCYCLMKKKVVFTYGDYLYQTIWITESLLCEREPFTSSDWHAVSVLKDDVIIGHFTKTAVMVFIIVYM